MVRHGVELHGGAASSEAITFTLICMEGAWVPSEAARFSCRFYTIRNRVYTRRCEKDQSNCAVISEHSVGRPLATEELTIKEGGRRHRSGIGADPDGFLRRPIAPVQDLGSAEDSNSRVFAYSAGNPR
jgi:hypothetical protein